MISFVCKDFKIKLCTKKTNIGLVILFFILWVIVGFNTKMSDTGNYLMFYGYACNGIRYSGVEYGFYLFMRVCSICGMDYFDFLKIYSFVALFMIFISINSYCKEPVKCMGLFLFFPFFHVIVAVRNFMSCAIVIYSMRFLWRDKKQKRNIIYFIIGIFFAALFHTAALFYLIYLSAYFKEKHIYRIVFGILAVSIICFTFGKRLYPLLIKFFPKLEHYLSVGLDGTRFSTKIFLVMFYITCLFFCHALKPYMISKMSHMMQRMLVLNSLIMILSFFDMNFMRLQYNIMVVFSIFVLNTIEEAKQKGAYSDSLKNIGYLYYIFYFVSGFFLLYLYSFESIVLTVLTNNSLF